MASSFNFLIMKDPGFACFNYASLLWMRLTIGQYKCKVTGPFTAKNDVLIGSLHHRLYYLQRAAVGHWGTLLVKCEIPSQHDVVYLEALSLSGPSEETHHHNRMMSDQGNTFMGARGCSVLLFCACIINILAVSLWMKQAVEDWWELAKRVEWAANRHQWSETILQMGACLSKRI